MHTCKVLTTSEPVLTWNNTIILHEQNQPWGIIHRMNSEGKQYSPHQMDLPTHSNANTGTLCLNLEYPWSRQRKHFRIFSLFHLAWQKKTI
jgi:hypothetical protein